MSRPVILQTLRPVCTARPTSLPCFLIPSWSSSAQHQCIPKPLSSAPFSTSQPLSKGKRNRDYSKNRGISAIRRTGLPKRKTLSIPKDEPLPRPVTDPALLPKIETDPKHGLWGFFASNEEGRHLKTIDELNDHGRSWDIEELRQKSWEDLHALWWKCTLERNSLETQRLERIRLDIGYGDYEGNERDKVVRETMKSIKDTLLERWFAWEDARRLARDDPEIDLTTKVNGKLRPTYTPDISYSYDDEEEYQKDTRGVLAEGVVPVEEPEVTQKVDLSTSTLRNSDGRKEISP